MKCAEKNRFELAMRAWGDSFLRELCLTRKIVRDRCCRTQDFFCGRCGLALFEKRHLVEGVITGFFKAVRFFLAASRFQVVTGTPLSLQSL